VLRGPRHNLSAARRVVNVRGGDHALSAARRRARAPGSARLAVASARPVGAAVEAAVPSPMEDQRRAGSGAQGLDLAYEDRVVAGVEARVHAAEHVGDGPGDDREAVEGLERVLAGGG